MQYVSDLKARTQTTGDTYWKMVKRSERPLIVTRGSERVTAILTPRDVNVFLI